MYSEAINYATDIKKSETIRCEALQLVGIGIASSSDEKELLLELISPSVPTSVQIEAINRLSHFSESSTCDSALDRWPSMSKKVRDHLISKMIQRSSWTERLLTALESNLVAINDLSVATVKQLSVTGSRSMRVRAERLFRRGTGEAKEHLVQRYLDELDNDRDVMQGASLFRKHCAVCHVSTPDSEAVGASLDNLTDRSDRALLTAILDPNRAVDPRYQSYVVMTTDARVLAGVITEESGNSFTIAHTDGKRTTIQRNEIEEMKNIGTSLMPDGFEKTLDPHKVQDILAYLQQPTLFEHLARFTTLKLSFRGRRLSSRRSLMIRIFQGFLLSKWFMLASILIRVIFPNKPHRLVSIN